MRTLLAYSSWWLGMGSMFAVAAWLAGGEAPSPGLVLGMTIANSAAIALAEQFLPWRPGVSLLRDRQAINDALHGTLFSFAGRPLAMGGALALATAAASLLDAPLPLWPRQAPLAAQVALALALWSLAGYGYHRALHACDALWWFHALHHDTRQLHLLKSGRIHVGEEALRYLVLPAPLLFAGAPAEVMAWMALWHVAEGNLAHSNLDQRFPSFCHYLLPTPQLHRIHHAEPRHLQDSNFGGVTPLWDLLFGTYRHPDRHPVERTGIAGDPVPRGFFAQLAYPLHALRGSGAAAAAGGPAAVRPPGGTAGGG